MEQPEEEELNDDGLSESDRIKLEHAMLDIAYENAYALLTGQTTFEGLLHDKAKFGLSTIMAFDPVNGPTKDDIEGMIGYYVDLDETEYYLRCAELKKILHEKFPESISG